MRRLAPVAQTDAPNTMEDFEELMRIQRQMAGRIVQESETDKKLKMMDVINNLVTARNKKVQIEQVILEAQLEGIAEDDAIGLIDDLADLGFIESEDGFVKRA